MDRESKTKKELVKELAEMVQRVAKLEAQQTRHKQTDRELREGEARHRRLLELCPEAVAVHSKGRIVYINAAGAKMLGVTSPEKLVGKSVMDFVHPDYREITKKRIRGGLERRKKARPVEEKLVRPDGKVIYVETTATRVTYRGESAILAVSRDITERKKMEEALENSAREWRTTFDAIGDIVFLADLEGRIVRCNRTMANFVGEQPKGIIGRICWKLIHGTQKRVEGCPMERMQKSHRRETMVLSMGERCFEVIVDPLLDEVGGLVGGVHIVVDITGQKEAEKKIEAYEKRLRSLASELTLIEERERRNLASELHESISQLLALCRVKLGELEEVTELPDARLLVKEVEEHLEEIIWHTRSLTLRLGPPVLYEYGLEPALEWLVEHMQEQYGIDTKLKVDAETDPRDEELRIFLFRAVQELMTNIAKHTGTDKAKVSVLRVNDTVRVSVKNRGVGFDPTILEALSNKDKGFGLFSIGERIKYFGGKLSIQSKPGEGTQVILTVPLKALPGKK
jgi:PAS domain S-box-containing protein